MGFGGSEIVITVFNNIIYIHCDACMIISDFYDEDEM